MRTAVLADPAPAGLDHPGIVRVYQAGEVDGVPFLAGLRTAYRGGSRPDAAKDEQGLRVCRSAE